MDHETMTGGMGGFFSIWFFFILKVEGVVQQILFFQLLLFTNASAALLRFYACE